MIWGLINFIFAKSSFYLTIIGRWILSILSATNISFSVNKYKSLLNKRKSQLLI